MDSNLGEIEEMIEQPDIPVGGAAGADMAEDAARLARQILGAERGDRTGPHVGDRGGVEQRARHAGARIEQVEERHLRGQAALVVVDIVADDLDPGEIEWREVAAQHVEMAVERLVRDEVHARLDDRLALALGAQAALDGVKNLLVGHCQRRNVRTAQIGKMDFGHG